MAAPVRVVSLIASATEIVWALGRGADLVGRSHECDHPPFVRGLPACTEPKLDAGRPSREIDDQVKRLLRDALSVYRVDADLLRRLRPDVILTQVQCEVCAVSLRDVEEAVADWVEGRPRVVSLAPNALADVWQDIRRVAEALGVPGKGEELVQALTRRMEAVAEGTQQLRDRPEVACVEWIDPLMASGNWMPELVEMAGGRNLFGTAGKHAPGLAWEDLVRADPEVILVLPCGFDLPRTRREMPGLTERPGWKDLRAVRSGRLYLLDGNRYFNRPGPRLAESLEIFAEIFHPEHFNFGHRGDGWVPFEA